MLFRIEMKPDMKDILFNIDDKKYIFMIPDVIKRILPYTNFVKIYCLAHYLDDKGDIWITSRQYTDENDVVFLMEKDWRL